MSSVRSAVSSVQDKSKKCKEHQKRLVGTVREAAMAPYEGTQEPKRLLRSILSA
jgi:hypothetical protein